MRWQGRSVQTPAASSSTPSRSRPLRGAKGRRSSRAAHQPARLALLATTINCAIAALIRDAGTPTVEDRVRALRSELDVAGLTSMTPTLELAHAFHQAVLDDREALTDTIARLRAQTRDGTYAYYTDIVHFMAGLPLPADHPAPHWLDGEVATRARWHDLVTTRRDLLHVRR
ncbi:hypothetical protein [Streptomyces lanatus]|uniref:Uncharacterized protein n=1 Tax=Streptomyces lanatus TaxID=66900 RepID=A0ABV1Y3X7_9ACTN|nr:hypothetical protein [Streptomyces lanatus]GHH27547.1 hypothetical protein GCM10018780_83010 [Streptomyces lanatus]